VIAFVGGMLGGRFGNRRVTLSALALMTIGGLGTALGPAFWLVASGRVVSGAGGVLLTLILTKMTAEWFREHEISERVSYCARPMWSSSSFVTSSGAWSVRKWPPPAITAS